MPLPCKNPKYGYTKNKKVRLAFCGNKIVETKSKKVIDLERKFKHKIYYHKKSNKHYYKIKNNKIYVT